MAIKTGSFTKSTGAAPVSQSITDVGFTPQVLILWTTLNTASGSWVADGDFAIGHSVGASSSRAVAVSMQDNSYGSGNSRQASKILTFVDHDGTVLFEAALTSFDVSGFTLNWTTNDGNAYIINYVALRGGTNFQYSLVEWTTQAAGGVQAVTGAGFQPDFVWNIGSGSNTVPDTMTAAGWLSIGAMSSSGDQFSTSLVAYDGAIAPGSETDITHCYAMRGYGEAFHAHWHSMDADGFTIHWGEPGEGLPPAYKVFSLCLKGGDYKLSKFAASTSTSVPVEQAVTSVGFAPEGVLLFTPGKQIPTVISYQPTGIGLGAFDGANERSAWASDQGDWNPTNANRVCSTAKVLVNELTTFDGNATDAEADGTSLDSDGFTISWSKNAAVARDVVYAAMRPSETDAVAQYRGRHGKAVIDGVEYAYPT